MLCSCRKAGGSADGTDADTQTEEGRTENNPFPGSGRNREVLPFGWGKPLHDAEDGTKEIGLCRFVDGKQVDVNGQIWEIGEFLWQMERRGIQVYPLETA